MLTRIEIHLNSEILCAPDCEERREVSPYLFFIFFLSLLFYMILFGAEKTGEWRK
jgi:hypothetical protein